MGLKDRYTSQTNFTRADVERNKEGKKTIVWRRRCGVKKNLGTRKGFQEVQKRRKGRCGAEGDLGILMANRLG
jgi:hypothetical protein